MVYSCRPVSLDYRTRAWICEMKHPKDPDSEQAKMAELAAVPAILAFPPEVYAQLIELCELRGWTPNRLVVEAVRSQRGRVSQLIEELEPLEPGEIEIWPEDPLNALARVVALHAMRLFIKSFEDPAGYEEFKKQAPAEWSFRCLDGPRDDDDQPRTWWQDAE